MVERLYVLEHHIERVRSWDTPGLSPEEAARKRVEQWNRWVTIRPETSEFIDGLARVIDAYRRGIEMVPLDDFNDDRTLDPICRACMKCPNPVRDLQLRLPGFEGFIDPQREMPDQPV